jgi:DNA-binding XRE family transcriptional regulator
MTLQEGAAHYTSLKRDQWHASSATRHRLRALRRGAGLTQGELAYLLGGLSRHAMTRIEQRWCPPSLPLILGLEQLFRVPIREIYPFLADEVEHSLFERALLLRASFEGKDDCQSAYKREVLRTLIERMELVPIRRSEKFESCISV